jgi:hypothetical protein
VSQPILSKEQYEELRTTLGRLNGQFSRDALSDYTGSSIHGIMVTDPNHGNIRFNAQFPCRTSSKHYPSEQVQRMREYEIGGNVNHAPVLQTDQYGWYASLKLGCPSVNNFDVYLPQYPGGPEQFAAAIQSITRIPIQWHYVAMALTDPTPIYGPETPHLQAPLPVTDPPVLLAHESVFIELLHNGVAEFGTGQGVNVPWAVLAKAHTYADHLPVRIIQAQSMDSWFWYRVEPA